MADNDETPQAADTSTIFLTEEIATKAFTLWDQRVKADPDSFIHVGEPGYDESCACAASYFFKLCEEVA
jgi:hypothetical protein